MNPSQRRAAERAGVPDVALDFAEDYRCLDCNAATDLDVIEGVVVLRVAHDETCPNFRQMAS